jgi:hypothetical protein
MVRPCPIPVELAPTALAYRKPVGEGRSVSRKRPDLSLGTRAGNERLHLDRSMMDRMQATGTPFGEKPEWAACLIFGRMPDLKNWRRASVNA